MGRIVGLDFGKARIGVAISDEMQIIARALGTVPNTPQFVHNLRLLLTKEGEIDKIVVGLPLTLKGQDSEMTLLARSFASNLTTDFSLSIELWDERLTSTMIEKSLQEAGLNRKKRAEKSDALSAVLILQSYLDCKKDLP